MNTPNVVVRFPGGDNVNVDVVAVAVNRSLFAVVGEQANLDVLFDKIDAQVKEVQSQITGLGTVLEQYESLAKSVETVAKSGNRYKYRTQMEKLMEFVREQNISEKVASHLIDRGRVWLSLLLTAQRESFQSN